MKKISFTVFIILILMLSFLTSLTSCGLISINGGDVTKPVGTGTSRPDSDFDETDPPDSVESQLPPTIPDPEKWQIRENEADAMLSGVVSLDFKGSTLFIVDSTTAFSSPLVENNVYSEAVYARNKKVSDKYGFTITVSSADGATLFDEFKSTVAGGETFADIISVPINKTGIYIQSGLLKNLRTLAFFDKSPSYEVSSFAGVNAAADDVYFSVGYATLTPSDMTVMYFNRTAVKNTSADLYSEILSGSFTLERYNEILIESTSNSVISPSVDASLISLEATGSTFFKTGYGTQISINASEANAAIASASRYLSVLLSKYISVESDSDDLSFESFEKGEAIFRIGVLSDVEEIYDDKVIWGLAPMPKSGDAEGYSTPINSSVACMLIPSNTTKGEMTSIAINALNAASYKWLIDSAALHYATYYLPDIYSIDVIKLICDSPVLDFAAGACSLSGKYTSVLFDTIKAAALDEKLDVSTILTSKSLSAVTSELKKYYSK